MDPMEYTYAAYDTSLLPDTIQKVKNTLFPEKNFIPEKNFNVYCDNTAREQFALSIHSQWNATSFEHLCFLIAEDFLTHSYCHWCRVDNRNDPTVRLIIEHQRIHGDAGRYRGVLCHRCYAIEGKIKNLNNTQKKIRLYQYIGKQVSREWVKNCIDNWYS